MLQKTERKAVLYRMVMDKHICPYGLKSKWLLKRKGFVVEDHHLKTREETDAFQREQNVETTPQTFIAGERVGGYDALRERFTDDRKASAKKSYTPVLVIFGASAIMAIAIAWATLGTVLTVRAIEWFAAFSMTLLAVQKLKDIESFSTMFLNYDLLAQREVSYSYIYPVAEAVAGLMMIAGGVFGLMAAPIALFIGAIGAVSVYEAVYVNKRELKCACIGGDSNVPLGFISLTENLVMVAMGLWMPMKFLLGE